MSDSSKIRLLIVRFGVRFGGQPEKLPIDKIEQSSYLLLNNLRGALPVVHKEGITSQLRLI